jgi:hypothetical protein
MHFGFAIHRKSAIMLFMEQRMKQMGEMLKKAIQDPTRYYASHNRAKLALERVVKKLGIQKASLRYIIACEEPDGIIRYFPVVLPTEAQLHLAFALAHNHIAVVRT